MRKYGIGLLCILLLSAGAQAQNHSEVYKKRRQALLEKLGRNSVAIFKAAPMVKRNGDVYFEYRQDSDFYYLTGFEEPEAVLILSKRGIYVRDESRFVHELLFLRPRNPQREIWEGYRLGVKRAKQKLGIEAAQPMEAFDDYLVAILMNTDTLYIKTERVGLDDPLSPEMELIKKARERLYDFVVRDPGRFLIPMRQRKDELELKRLQKAIDITVQAHREAMKACKPGMYEYELEAVIEYVFKKNGSERAGFPSIVGSGPNSCILHYNTNRRRMETGEVVVIDIGAEYGMYTADITRTIPVSGKFTRAQRELYSIVLAAQEAGIAECKIGNDFRAPARAAIRKVVEGLVRLGFLKGEVDTILRTRAYRAFLMHGISHYIGLDVHDVGTYRPFQENDIITVEPGIYISEQTGRLYQIPEEYWNIGIRIEDDILITRDGPKILSAGAPRRIEDIEQLMQQ